MDKRPQPPTSDDETKKTEGGITFGDTGSGRDANINLERVAGRDQITAGRDVIQAGTVIYMGETPKQATTSTGQPLPPCPYRGLFAFREDDKDIFFGRETLAQQLTDVVQHQRLVAVLGPSGSGKSSLVFAGLLPRLRSNSDWFIADFRPGSEPFKALAATLLSWLEPDLSETDRLVEINKLAHALIEGELSLVDVFQRIRQKQGRTGHYLLVADQFEELFTLCQDTARRQAFLDMLLATLNEPSLSALTLVPTLRADFMGQALAYRPLADALQDHTFMVRPMNAAELQKVIEQPALQHEVSFEPGLVARILADVGDEPGNLPLLEFALTLLWEESLTAPLTHQAYEAIGQVQGALANHADLIYDCLTPDKQAQTRRVMVQLVQPGVGTEDTRRQATRNELGETGWHLVQQLAGSETRLLVTNQDESGQETAEVIHEALIQRWERLQAWMTEDRDFRAWQERLRSTLHQWQAYEKRKEDLLQGTMLAEAQKWYKERGLDILTSEQLYIQASVQRKESGKRLQQDILVGLVVLAVVMVYLAVSSLINADKAEVNAQLALVREADAVSARQTSDANTVALSTTEADARQREIDAYEQARVAQSQALALLSQEDFPHLSETDLLLAIEATQLNLTSSSYKLLERFLNIFIPPVFSFSQEAPLTGALWNRDGKLLLTWGDSETAKVWAVYDGSLVFTLEHDNSIWGSKWNRDESQILTWSRNGIITSWSTQTGVRLFTLNHKGLIGEPQWNESQHRIVTLSGDGIIRVWNAQDGMLLFTLKHGAAVKSVIWNKHGNQLLTWGDDGNAKLWDTEKRILLVTFHHQTLIRESQWNQEEDKLFTLGDDGMVKIWDARSGILIYSFTHDDPISEAKWNKEGNWLLTWTSNSDFESSIKIWDVQSGTILFSLDQVFGLSSIYWNQEETQLVVASGDGSARIWDMQGRLLHTLKHEGPVDGAMWNQNGSELLTWSGLDETAKIWDSNSGKLLFTLIAGAEIVQAQWNQEENKLLTRTSSAQVKIWDAQTGSLLYILKNNEQVDGVQWGPDDVQLLTWNQGTVNIWNIQDGEPLFTLSHDAWVYGIEWNQDESKILTWSRDGTAKVWDLRWRTLLLILRHDDSVYGATWNRDESRLLTWSRDGTARVWNSNEGKLLFTLNHDGPVNGAQWNQEENRVLTWSEDGAVKVWDGHNGTLLLTLIHNVPVTEAVWDQEERMLLTLGGDGKVRVWDSERCITNCSFDQDNFTNYSTYLGTWWNKEGNRIIVMDSNLTLNIWDTQQQKPLFNFKSSYYIYGVRWNQDGSKFLTWNYDFGANLVWDATNGNLLYALNQMPIYGAHWSNDGNRLLIWGSSAEVWDTQVGVSLFNMMHGALLRGAQWNIDETQIATWGIGNDAKVWDGQNGNLLLVANPDGTSITTSYWRQNGRQILFGTESGTIGLYYTRIEDLLDLACQTVSRNLTWDEWQMYLSGQAYRQTCLNLPVHSSVPPEAREQE